jgi:hypothetical protein
VLSEFLSMDVAPLLLVDCYELEQVYFFPPYTFLFLFLNIKKKSIKNKCDGIHQVVHLFICHSHPCCPCCNVL